MTPGRRRWKIARLLPSGIRTRLYLLITLILVPMAILLGMVYRERYQTRSAQAVQTELEVAQGVATTFSAFLDNIWQTSSATGEAILSFQTFTVAKANRLLMAVAAQYPAVRGMNWVGPDGKVQASSHPELVGSDFSERSYFQQILSGRSRTVGDVTPRGKDIDAPVFGIASAARDRNGTLRGVVVTGVDPGRLGTLILTRERPAGGAYAIFDRNGTVVYRSPEASLSWEERVTWRQSDPLLVQAIESGVAQAGEVRLDIPGGVWLSARVPIPEVGWVAGAGRPLEVALAPVRRSLVSDAALAGLIAVAAFLLAWYLARSIARPLLQLERDAQRLGADGWIEAADDPGAPGEVRRLRTTVTGMAGDLLRRAEDLRASEENFRAVFEQAAVGMGRAGLHDLRWLDVNDALCRMLGYSPAEMRAIPWPQMTHPEDVQADLAPFRRMATGEMDSYTVEKRFIHKDGHPVWARLTLSLARDAEGRPVYEIAVIENITERKEAEEEVRRLHAELERRVEARTAELTVANRELEAFTYTVSHDLRAPLRHISGFVEMLDARLGPALDEEGKRYVEVIAAAARRMGALIDDLLTFSRLGRAPLNRRTVDLQHLMTEVRQELAAEAAGRRVEWKIGPLPEVQADPLLLRTVLTNLLANALKYTRRRDPAVIEVGCRQERGGVVCYVKDNGAGFDMRYAGKLFGVFQRLHRDAEFEGTGIGLASVQRIIQRHHGRVWAEGDVGKGAAFYFSLPHEGEEA